MLLEDLLLAGSTEDVGPEGEMDLDVVLEARA